MYPNPTFFIKISLFDFADATFIALTDIRLLRSFWRQLQWKDFSEVIAFCWNIMKTNIFCLCKDVHWWMRMKYDHKARWKIVIQ